MGSDWQIIRNVDWPVVPIFLPSDNGPVQILSHSRLVFGLIMKISALKKQLKPIIERIEMMSASDYILSRAQPCLRFRDLGK